MDTNSEYLKVLEDKVLSLQTNKNQDVINISHRGSIPEEFIELEIKNDRYEGYILINDSALQMITIEFDDIVGNKHFAWTNPVQSYSLDQVHLIINDLFESIKQNLIPEFFNKLNQLPTM